MQSMLSEQTVIHWNGPVCPTCDKPYLNSHKCSDEDIMKKVGKLLKLLSTPVKAEREESFAERCPCNPKNGGSGICGCIMGGPTITC